MDIWGWADSGENAYICYKSRDLDVILMGTPLKADVWHHQWCFGQETSKSLFKEDRLLTIRRMNVFTTTKYMILSYD